MKRPPCERGLSPPSDGDWGILSFRTSAGNRIPPPPSAVPLPFTREALEPFKYGEIRRFVGRLDTYIGNWGGVRLLGGGRPQGPPLRWRQCKPPGGAPSRRALQKLEPAPSSGPSGHLPPEGKAFWGNPPHSPLKGKAFGRLIAAPTERNPLGRAGEGTRPYGGV